MATGKPTRTGSSRVARTVLLGALALAAGLYWLSSEGWLDGEEMARYLLASLLFVAVPVALAALLAVVLRLLRRRR